MRKPIAEMTDHEMLLELMQEKRSVDQRRYVRLVCMAVAAGVLIILGVKYLPPVIAYFKEVRAATQQIEQTLGQIRQNTDNVLGIVRGLKDSGSEMLSSSIEQLEKYIGQLPDLSRVGELLERLPRLPW